MFLFPICLFAQTGNPAEQDITGLWKGSLFNDSTKKFLPYEIAISEEKGKLTGYSYTLFEDSGKKEIGVKRIKIKKKDGEVIIEDVEMISNNFSVAPPKKVRVQSILALYVSDTAMEMSGRWSTNRTWEYSQLTGTLQVKRSIEFKELALFEQLQELKLAKDLSFVKAAVKAQTANARVENPTVKNKMISDEPKETELKKALEPVAKLEPVKQDIKPAGQPTATNTSIENTPSIASPNPVKRTTELIAKDSVANKTKPTNDIAVKPVTKSLTPAAQQIDKKKDIVVAPSVKKENTLPVIERPKTIAAPKAAKNTAPVATVNKPVQKDDKTLADIAKKPFIKEKPVASITLPAVKVNDPVKPIITTALVTGAEQKTAVPVIATVPIVKAAANVAERKMKNEQSVYFESDSLVLTLYDNGEVDGDTVSVLMNGQIIFAKQGLTEKPNSKTIYIDKSITDSVSMVMYAESLGSIPPNTGLLIIMDGEKRYEVRFSADLQTNAAILLRRKPKE